jgi:hypothetical protein
MPLPEEKSVMTASLLLLAAALAAPVPDAKTDAPPAKAAEPNGAAPRLLFLKPDTDGILRIAVKRSIVDKNGKERNQSMVVELSQVKELDISSPDGKKIDFADAKRRLAKGSIILVPAGPGHPIPREYLAIFRSDVLVLRSPELNATAFGAANGPNFVPFRWNGVPPVPRAAPAPAPAVPPPAAPKE